MQSAHSVGLVVFDWAGTTVDHGCFGPVDAFIQAFATTGLAVTVAEVRGPMGLGKKDHIRAILCSQTVSNRWQQRHGRVWNDDDVESIYAEFEPLQVAAASNHAQLVPELLEAVRSINTTGRRIGTTTGYFRAAAEAVRHAAALQGYTPDYNLIPEAVSAGRPAPWMIFRLMEMARVSPPTAVIKVGDTVPDIQEARNAGAWAVGVLASSSDIGLTRPEYQSLSAYDRNQRLSVLREKLLSAGAHYTIDTLAELPAVIANIESHLASGTGP